MSFKDVHQVYHQRFLGFEIYLHTFSLYIWSNNSLIVIHKLSLLNIYIFYEDSPKATLTINTKYVNSFSMDPAPNSTPYLAASFSENTVALWDMRRFDRPLDTITEQDTILKVQWSPTKY